jgi:hypothetical protein
MGLGRANQIAPDPSTAQSVDDKEMQDIDAVACIHWPPMGHKGGKTDGYAAITCDQPKQRPIDEVCVHISKPARAGVAVMRT